MTRKHFVAFATIIQVHLDLAKTPHERRVVRSIAESIANTCARENTHFDRARFLTACGLNLESE